MRRVLLLGVVSVMCLVSPLVAAPPDKPPVADAGPDQLVHDNDLTGSETVTLDGSGSSSKKSVIVSWVWKEGTTQIATGETTQVSLDVGAHTITLIVTDANAMTDDDTCVVEVNAPPSADAGSDQEVTDSDSSGSETVTLDGSGSSDSDGTVASWVWKEGANQIATGETAQVDLAVGQHTITLEVTDDDGATDEDTCVVTVNEPSVNQPPVANAGSDQLVHDADLTGSETVTLDGSGSSDSDGTITSWEWKEGATPIATGETVQVSLAVGVHTITLVVTDDGAATDDDTCVVEVNAPPSADAGSDQNVTDNDDDGSETVTLDGSASSDSDGTIASWVWKEGATPIATGETVQVSLAVAVHTITLEVTDDDGATDVDTVVVTVNPKPNDPPVADAGEDQNVVDEDENGSETVTLDGSGSSDSDGTIVSWVWKEGITQIATGETAQVSLDVGQHTITLEVTDDDSATDTDDVVVTVSEPAGLVQLDLTGGFNMDGWCGPKEMQECYIDGAHDLIELFGDLPQGNGNYILQQGVWMIGDSTSTGFGEPYSISGQWFHPLYVSGTEGTPEDGIILGAGDREYHVASTLGNATLSGDWTEVADPSTYTLKDNCVVVGASHNIATWQISEVVVELPAGQKGQYSDVNFVIAAMNQADRARNMEIYALYGDGTDESLLYAFSTADGGSGPVMTDTDGGVDFDIVYAMSKAYSSTSGSTGAVVAKTSNLFEFAAPLDLNSSKTLYGFKICDSNPTLNWNARGVTIFAATATSGAGANQAPVADAGSDQMVHDEDQTGSELVTLDGSGSSDSDGTIVSWVWKEGQTQIATGETAQVNLAVGLHTITLTVTDNDSATDSDTVDVIVNAAPVAVAGDDQTVYDEDETGSELVTLDGSGSSDADGTIVSWVWKEGETQIATGETAQVNLAVGQHTILLTVTDDDDGTGSDTVVVTVSDNHPPVADAGADQVPVEDDDDNGSETITLDGSGSSDQDGTIVSYVWKDAEGTQIATGQTAQVSLTVGINDITLVVTDDDNDTARDVVRIWIIPDVDYYVDQGDPAASDSNNGSESEPWLTINHAVDNVSAGDVILVREGIYREWVTLGVSGSSGSPITLLGYPGERVIVSGADEITGWTQCTSEIAKGNPYYASIYYADIAWLPTRLAQDEFDLAVAKTPNNGWFVCTGGTESTLVDTNNLTEADDYWNGATAFLWDVSTTTQAARTVTDYDQASHTLTISGTWAVPEANVDRYILRNKVELINEQGEWAAEDIGGGTYRVYCWADGGGDPDSYMMEGSRRDRFNVEWGTHGYWILDNLEMRHNQNMGTGSWSSSCAGHITVRNCIIRHNDSSGLSGRYNEYGQYDHNLVICNGAIGVDNGGKSNVVIEYNEVGWNEVDGVRTIGPYDYINWAEYVTLRGNYIHDHAVWSHADNCQSYGQIRYLTIEDNLLIHAIQGYMMEGTEYATYTNNIILGAGAYLIILGHENTFYTTFENNTLCFSGYGLVAHSADDYTYLNNVLQMGHDGGVWGADSSDTYSSDYNCFWQGDGFTTCPVTWPGASTFAEYVSLSGEDSHSYHADPKLANVPEYFCMLDSSRQDEFTTTRVYLPSGYTSMFQAGDHIEIDWDGTVRTVTAVGTDYLDFTPASYAAAFKAGQVANWKDKTDYNLDFHLKTGSPAIGTADDNGDMGADIDAQSYINGDFNGDGRRDIPAWPPLP